jgi:hypothetical protein
MLLLLAPASIMLNLLGYMNFPPPTEHALRTSTPEDIVGYIPGKTNLEHMKRHKTFALSYPIATSEEQQRATTKVVNAYNGYYSNRCEALLAGCQFGISESRGVVEALFIDLTPTVPTPHAPKDRRPPLASP